MPGGGGREAQVARMWLVARGWGLSVWVTSRGGKGLEGGQPALPRPAGHGRCPGDKMIDWVSPACGDAAAQSNSRLWHG